MKAHGILTHTQTQSCISLWCGSALFNLWDPRSAQVWYVSPLQRQLCLGRKLRYGPSFTIQEAERISSFPRHHNLASCSSSFTSTHADQPHPPHCTQTCPTSPVHSHTLSLHICYHGKEIGGRCASSDPEARSHGGSNGPRSQ